MKQSNLVKLGLITAIASLYSGSVLAASVGGDASANVVAPLTITETTTLDFGDFSRGTGGSVTMDNDAGNTRTGSGVDLITTSGTPTRGVFAVSGATSKAITVTTDFTGASLAETGGDTMALAVNGGQSVAFPTTTDGTGAATVNVGGIITVGAAQTTGAYSTTTGGGSSYQVTVNYD